MIRLVKLSVSNSMTKTIMVMALAATLILGTFTMDSTFAVESGDVILFKGKTNKVVVDPASNWPSKAKAEAIRPP